MNRVLKNTFFTGLRFGAYILANFILIRFFIDQFGKSSFGLIALGGFLTQYVGIAARCIGNAVGRFMNVALNRNDWDQASEIFSTAIVANLVVIALQIPLFAWGVWKLDLIVEFPPEVASDFRALVVCNILLFFLNLIRGAVFTPIMAANRLDISDKFDIASHLARLVLVITLILNFGPKLWLIGAVELLIACVIFFFGLSIFRKLVHEHLVFSLKCINWKWAKPILSMAFWMMAFALGQAFFVKTDVWVVNKFVSDEMAGIYAALLILPNALRHIGNQVSTLITPVYMIDFARENTERIALSCVFLTKMLSLFAAIGGGVLCGLSPLILRVWLNDEFVAYTPLLFLMLLYVVLTLNKAVTWPVFPAFNKVNQLGIATLLCGLLNLVLSIVLARCGYGTYGVAAATLFSLFLLYGLLYPWRVCRILGIRLRPFMWNHLYTLLLFLAVTKGCSFFVSAPVHLFVRMLGILVVLAAAALLGWRVVLNDQERAKFFAGVDLIKGKLNGLFSR